MREMSPELAADQLGARLRLHAVRDDLGDRSGLARGEVQPRRSFRESSTFPFAPIGTDAEGPR
jgi:hypothetical protein